MASHGSLAILVFVLSFTSVAYAQPLSSTFYRKLCPNLVTTVRSMVSDVIANERRMGASLLRLHFHDCFVSGCDASILLDVEGGEKDSVHNVNSLRGFEVIDTIKERVDNECQNLVVSCADIIALVARESVVALGGPSWPMVYGRRDSTILASAETTDNQLSFASDNLPNLISLFARKGFSPKEMVALSGAHTIGQARCIRFRDRIYNEPNIALSSVVTLQEVCPKTPGEGDDNLAPLDIVSSDIFNNDYFEDLLDFHGVLHSDQVLYTGKGSRIDRIVELYANNERKFFTDFSAAMSKMSKLGVKTGKRGMIRTNCRSAS